MSATLDTLLREPARSEAFPICRNKVFMAHAGVTALPRCVTEAMADSLEANAPDHQHTMEVWSKVQDTRKVAAELLNAEAGEFALLGPTSLGLNLVANGLPWEEGDEVVYYPDDYPANVYPWTGLRERGVKPVALRPGRPGAITWPVVEAALTERTRLVALASCHFLSGFRVDIDGIGRRLRERGILFSLDGIQTIGSAPVSLRHVDFMSADAHKWMLGPVAAGLFYVKAERQELLRPTLLGAWNVHSPDFIAQDEIVLEPGARRYEPGSANLPGILGMRAALMLLRETGLDRVEAQILELRRRLVEGALERGYRVYGAAEGERDHPEGHRSGIVSFVHDTSDLESIVREMARRDIVVILRRDREGRSILRVSPHFYNTDEETERVIEAL